MSSDINELDVNDIGLKAIFGDRWHDETKSAAMAAEKRKEAAGKPMVSNVPKEKAMDARLEPEAKAENGMDKVIRCAKCLLLFGGLSCLFFYWQQSGQMADSAAVPSMCACFALAGFGVGSSAVKGDR